MINSLLGVVVSIPSSFLSITTKFPQGIQNIRPLTYVRAIFYLVTFFISNENVDIKFSAHDAFLE